MVLEGRAVSFDFALLNPLKVVEFYGDYWHANPRQYGPKDQLRGMIVEQLWARDEARISLISKHAPVKVIWEHQALTERTRTLQECLTFLKSV